MDERIEGTGSVERRHLAGPGLWITDTEPASVDTRKLRADRLARLRDMMREKEYAALLLFDPNNQRYATGSRNMFGYFLRNSTRYFFVPTEGADHSVRVPSKRTRLDLPGNHSGGAQFKDRLVVRGGPRRRHSSTVCRGDRRSRARIRSRIKEARS